MKPFSSARPYALSLLRIISGFVLWLHGLQKFVGILGWQRPPVGSLPYFAGWIETFGGMLIIVGLLTVPLAFLLSGEMAVAYFVIHFPSGIWPTTNGGDPAVLLCFIFLYIFTAGPGPISLDHFIWKPKPAAQTT
jgi:putative oxidoreductase